MRQTEEEAQELHVSDRRADSSPLGEIAVEKVQWERRRQKGSKRKISGRATSALEGASGSRD